MFIKNQYHEISRCVEVPRSCAHCLEVFFGKDNGSEFTENRKLYGIGNTAAIFNMFSRNMVIKNEKIGQLLTNCW